MILVVLGTHELPFTRLLKEVERVKMEGYVDDEIIVQNGHTAFESDVLRLKPFVSYEEMDSLYDEARLIIAHAGSGSIINGLKKDKKVVAAPRLKEYGEHNDDHQLELVDTFEKAGHIVSLQAGESLETAIAKAENFTPMPFYSEKQKMFDTLNQFIRRV